MRSECIRFGGLTLAACGLLVFFESPIFCQSEVDRPTILDREAESPKSFYAAGTLQKVRRKDNGSERIALTDGQGAITAFIAPAKRVDLRRYIGREVAIKGRVLNPNDDNAPYIAADTITEMFGITDNPRNDVTRRIATVNFEEEMAPEHISLAQQITSGPVIGGPVTGGPWQPVPGGGIVEGGIVTDMQSTPVMGSPCASGTCGGDCGGSCGNPCRADTGLVSSCQPCGVCGARTCETCTCVNPCVCGPPGWLWLRGEYLLWWGDKMDLPPLVTTGPSDDPASAGVLGAPGTSILYGNDSILGNGRSGFRINFGGFFGPERKIGWEAEYLNVGSVTENFTASSDANGNPVIGRPFVNVNPRDDNGNLLPPGLNDVQFVSFPGLVAGTVTVDSESMLQAAAGRLRFNICCKQYRRPCSPCGPCGHVPCGYPPFMKVDFTAGYRYAGLDESVVIREDLVSLQDPETIEIFDSFRTRSDFHGGEIGTIFESGWNRWTFDTLMRVALGGVRQEVTIDGGTTITTFGSPSQQFVGGLLAQTTNIGSYSRDDFAMVPELAANLGLYLTPRLRWTVGYTFFYFSNVVRPGDQIDLDVNPDFVPPPVANPVGLARPEFVFHTTDFWAHGLNTGLDFRW